MNTSEYYVAYLQNRENSGFYKEFTVMARSEREAIKETHERYLSAPSNYRDQFTLQGAFVARAVDIAPVYFDEVVKRTSNLGVSFTLRWDTRYSQRWDSSSGQFSLFWDKIPDVWTAECRTQKVSVRSEPQATSNQALQTLLDNGGEWVKAAYRSLREIESEKT